MLSLGDSSGLSQALEFEHESASEGAVSFDRGFVPRHPTAARLPESHRLWDELAHDLPGLFLSNRAQSVLERASVLGATARELPAPALTRASVVLSALAHAYWRFGGARFFPQRITQVPSALPPSILVPWQEVSRRLGRHEPSRPFQNFYDLFLSNYRLRAGVPADAPRIIENLEVLVPSFRNEAERVFYMSFVEMHYHLTPLVYVISEIEQAVNEDVPGDVARALGRVEAGLAKATGVWNKISARAGSRVYCDPVLWSKTVAILGVPPHGTPQGATSGAAAPMLHALDGLLARQSYDSHYGRFLLEHATNFVAQPVRELASRARKIDLPRYVELRAATEPSLREAYEGVHAAYSGDRGWLGRHAAKVFNYLCISTITGRNASVSGHERYFSRQTWVEATSELHESRAERASPTTCPVTQAASGCPASRHAPRSGVRARQEPARARADLREFSAKELARASLRGELWLAIDGLVYDVKPYLRKHPGGSAILQAYASQDVTEVFWSQIGHHADFIPALLERHVIGRLVTSEAELADPALREVRSILLRCQHSSLLQYDHAFDGNLGLKLMADENAHLLLLEENLPAVFELLSHDVWTQLASTTLARRVRANAQHLSTSLDFSGELSRDSILRVRERCDTLRSWDLTLIARLLERVLAAIDAGAGDAESERHRLARELEREVAAYFTALDPSA